MKGLVVYYDTIKVGIIFSQETKDIKVLEEITACINKSIDMLMI